MLFISFSYGITIILLSGYLTVAGTVNNAIRHKRRAIERKCMQTRENKMPSQSGNSDKGKQPGHIAKPDIEKHTISGARKEW